MSAPNKAYDPVEVAALAPDEVQRRQAEALSAIAGACDLDELKAARVAHAGDRAPLALARAEIGALPPAARAEAGKRVGAALAAIRQALTERQAELEAERDDRVMVEEAVDVTLPWDHSLPGARHPVSTVGERLVDIFVAGPDGAERSGVLLRTHTSPVQVRALLTRPLPLYVVSPGKCYRTDTLDATHSPVFNQIECLAVDEGLTMADLRGAINAVVAAMFGPGLQTRLRPDFFPFTEPSADVSMQCHVCRGASTEPGGDPCRVCRSQGWIEIAGCGMVNPRVLIACGIDPDRYSGFAFGLGIDRSVMVRSGVEDIRDTLEGDVRFSRAFGMEA